MVDTSAIHSVQQMQNSPFLKQIYFEQCTLSEQLLLRPIPLETPFSWQFDLCNFESQLKTISDLSRVQIYRFYSKRVQSTRKQTTVQMPYFCRISYSFNLTTSKMGNTPNCRLLLFCGLCCDQKLRRRSTKKPLTLKNTNCACSGYSCMDRICKTEYV